MGTVYKNAGIEAARIGGRDPEMDVAANRVRGGVLAELSSHNKTGQYGGKVRTRNVRGRSGVRDRLVEGTDPAILHIEYGHWWVTPMGDRIKWVKGLFIFRNAFRKAG